MDVSFDFSEVEALSASLASATTRIPVEVRKAVSKGALNVKNDARGRVSSHPTWSRLAVTLNYEMEGNAAFARATVGYDDVGQGELAGIAEFGSARHAPHPALLPALADEQPRFEKVLGDLGAKLVRDAL